VPSFLSRIRRSAKKRRRVASAAGSRRARRSRKITNITKRRKRTSTLFGRSSLKRRSGKIKKYSKRKLTMWGKRGGGKRPKGLHLESKRNRRIRNRKKLQRPIRRPKTRIRTKGKLTSKQRASAFRNRNRLRMKKAILTQKATSARDVMNQRVEEAKGKVQKKLRSRKKKVPTITKEELISELRLSLKKQFMKHGRSAPSYTGTITEILSPDEVKVDTVMNTKQLDTGYLWRDFEIDYPVKESVEISGVELEEKDLIIGEQEFDIDQKTLYLNEIRTRSEELVTRVLQFFKMNGFLTGSIDDMADLSHKSTDMIKMVTDNLGKAQDKFTIVQQHSASLAAIHKNPSGCKGPLDSIAPDVIPVFEFFNTRTRDYMYTTNFEWNIEQDPGLGYFKQTTFKGSIKWKSGKSATVQWESIFNDYTKIDEQVVNLETTPDKRSEINFGDDTPAAGAPTDNFITMNEAFWKPAEAGKTQFQYQTDDTGFLEIMWPGGDWERICVSEHPNWAKSKFLNIPKEWVDKGVRIPLRWMQSEGSGKAKWGIQTYVKGSTKKKSRQEPIYKTVWKWRGRTTVHRGYKTVWYIGEGWDYLTPKQLSLAAPENWQYNTVAFGAYDPLLAEHMDATKHVLVHKMSTGPTNTDAFAAAGRKTKNATGGDPSRANEAAGLHYLSTQDAGPKDHKYYKPDYWKSLGTEFAALKGPLPAPHPTYRKEVEIITNKKTKKERLNVRGAAESFEISRKEVVEQGKTLPIHYFYNKTTGVYRFRPIEDGRVRQARTKEGEVKVTKDNVPVMEKLEDKTGTNYVPELAGINHSVKWKNKPVSPIEIGGGFEWKGIAFYAYEPPSIPPNVGPIVQIYYGRRVAPTKLQIRAGWGVLEKAITLTCKASDPDGKVVRYIWKLDRQTSDIRSVKAERPKVLSRTGNLKYTFPIGKTTISVTVTDNRGATAKDIIDVIILTPEQKNWRKWSYNEMTQLQGNIFKIPYLWRKDRGWPYSDKHGSGVSDMNKEAYDFYSLGFNDSRRGSARRSSRSLDAHKFSKQKKYKEQVVSSTYRKFKLWRGWRTEKRYKTVNRVKNYTVSGAQMTTHKAVTDLAKQQGLSGNIKSIGVSETGIDKRMKGIYDAGYSHGKVGPHYIIENDTSPNIVKSDSAMRRQVRRQVRPIRNVVKSAQRAVRKVARKIGRWFRRWSDIRLKDNLIMVGQSESGINIYEYNYIWNRPGTKKFRGVIAQELLEIHPKAVGKRFGYYTVNYNKIDVDFEKVKN